MNVRGSCEDRHIVTALDHAASTHHSPQARVTDPE
jgi:hypothetical protein